MTSLGWEESEWQLKTTSVMVIINGIKSTSFTPRPVTGQTNLVPQDPGYGTVLLGKGYGVSGDTRVQNV
jgi:hypothetical protein